MYILIELFTKGQRTLLSQAWQIKEEFLEANTWAEFEGKGITLQLKEKSEKARDMCLGRR